MGILETVKQNRSVWVLDLLLLLLLLSSLLLSTRWLLYVLIKSLVLKCGHPGWLWAGSKIPVGGLEGLTKPYPSSQCMSSGLYSVLTVQNWSETYVKCKNSCCKGKASKTNKKSGVEGGGNIISTKRRTMNEGRTTTVWTDVHTNGARYRRRFRVFEVVCIQTPTNRYSRGSVSLSFNFGLF